MSKAHSESERQLGDIASKVIFENDRVRIWKLVLEPGEEGETHRHDLDHILVQIDGDRMAAVPEPDTAGPYDRYVEADITPGHVLFVPKGGVETARNVGNKRFHEVVIELKEPAG